MAQLITVQYARTDGRVAVWERNPDHPTGEIYIASAGTYAVAQTAGILSALREGSLIEVRTPVAIEERAPAAPAKAAK